MSKTRLYPVMAFATLLACIASAQAEEPGVPGKTVATQTAIPAVTSTTGLNVFYEKYGRFSTSVDAAGSNDAFHKISVDKPDAQATVDRAFLLAASNSSGKILKGDITLDGKTVTWSKSVFNGVAGASAEFFNNVLGDVTNIVKNKIDAAAPGTITFKIVEKSAKTTLIDGEILVVVFRRPNRNPHTVSLMFGAQPNYSDRWVARLNPPIDPNANGATFNMGVGISFSCQNRSVCSNFSSQYTSIMVNGKQPLTNSAGGEDDGSSANGALITAGGIGDAFNHAKPSVGPANPRTDNEKYRLLSYIDATTKVVTIDTSTPSAGDNLFFSWFEISTQATINGQ